MTSSPRRSVNELNPVSHPGNMAPSVNESVAIDIPAPNTQDAQAVPPADGKPGPPPKDGIQNPMAQSDSPKASTKAAPTTIEQNTAFWEAYNKAGDLEDKEFVKTSGSDLDALLIFAGLFSATNTAFIIESCKNLKADPTDETNRLLRSVLNATINPLNATPDATPFAASPRDIRINAFFFASLCCSLSVAFGAVLAKQWLTQYDLDGGGSFKAPATRGRERQRKYEGRDKWHLEDVIVTLPTLLQFSLFFFFVGLIDLLWPLDKIVMGITLGSTLATFAFYVTTITISIYDGSAPFQTRLSFHLRSLLLRAWRFTRAPLQNLWGLVRSILRHIWGITRSILQWIMYIARVPLHHIWGLVLQSILHHVYVLVAWQPKRIWGLVVRSLVRHVCRLIGAQLKAFLTAPLPSNHATAKRNIDIPCISYLLERVSKPGDLKTVAEAFILVADDPDAVKITSPFIDFHLKPTVGEGTSWTIPSLSGPPRSSLLRILNILVKEWKKARSGYIKTELYLIHHATFFRSILGELRRAFLADPTDAECCLYISDILHTLQTEHSYSVPDHSGTQMAAWQSAWLEDDVTKNLESGDAAARNTLTMLNLATRGCAERRSAWGIVDNAKHKNKRLKRIIHSTAWKEISTIGSAEVAGGQNSVRLLEWMVDYGMDGLADVLEDFSRTPGSSVAAVRPLISTVIKVIVLPHLRPTLDGWWRLPSLHGADWRSFLRILHVIIVSWQYLEADLDNDAEPFEPQYVSSLRAELWELFKTKKEDPETVCMISDICRNLPNPSYGFTSITAMRRVSDVMFAVSRDDIAEPAEPAILQHSISMLRSNARSLIFFAEFYAIRDDPGTSRAIPDYLRSIRKGEDPIDTENFWRATFRVQLFPVFLPDQLLGLKFAEYLHLWLEYYYHQARYDETRRMWMNWTYLLSLRQMLSAAESPEAVDEVAKELKEQDHRSHLLDIYDRYNYDPNDTCGTLALYLFLRLWSIDESDVREEDVRSVVTGLYYQKLPLTTVMRDFKTYTKSFRVDNSSEEEWTEEIASQATKDMGQMVKWLYSYLEAAVQRGFIDSEVWDNRLDYYSNWCDEMDNHMKTKEYRQLVDDLRGLRWCPRET